MRRWDIHLLRAVAILAVFGFHAGIPGVGGGELGVDVFFVISGYLITTTLLRVREEKGSLKTFYRKRLARTIPAAVLTISVTMVLVIVLARETFFDVVWHMVASLLWVENLLVSGILLTNASVPAITPYTHFWSLALEEQFYLVWPWLIAAVAGFVTARGYYQHFKIVLTITLVTIIGISYSLYVVLNVVSHAVAYFSPVTRVWELAVGALVAVWVPCRMHQLEPSRVQRMVGGTVFVLGMVGILFAFNRGRFLESTDSPFWSVLIVSATALMVASGSLMKNLSPKMLWMLTPLMMMGTISYGLYLWHSPVLMLLEETPVTTLPVAATVMIAGICSLTLAALSWIFVEKPFIAWSHRPPPADIVTPMPVHTLSEQREFVKVG